MKNSFLLTVISFFLNTVTAFIIYRFIGGQSSIGSYIITTLALIEISRLFLTGDLGFTNNFMRLSSKQSVERIFLLYKRLARLMFFVACFTSFAFVVFTLVTNTRYVQEEMFFFFLIVASLFLTFLGYPETAYLRVRERFKLVYGIQIVINIIILAFVFLCDLVVSWPLEFLVIANFFKSLTIYLVQILLVHKFDESFFIIKGFRNQNTYAKESNAQVGNIREYLSEIRFDSSSITIAFLLLTMVDSYIISMGSEDSVLLFQVIFVKKCFDVIRGVIESVIQVFSVYLSKGQVKNSLFFLVAVALLHIAFIPVVYAFVHYWLLEAVVTILIIALICGIYLLIALFRVLTIQQYFESGWSNTAGFGFIFISIAIQIVFYFSMEFVGIVYALAIKALSLILMLLFLFAAMRVFKVDSYKN